MANPTTNYGFVLPTSTDLVTDLPADFDVALQGVDTRLKALQPGTTLGDLAYSSATANTNTRLPIGTNGQYLSVSGGVPAWAGISAGGMTLLSTTTLSGAGVTVSSIDQSYVNLVIVIRNAFGTSSQNIEIQPNSTSTSSFYCGVEGFGTASSKDKIDFGTIPTSTQPANSMIVVINQYANSTHGKPVQFYGTMRQTYPTTFNYGGLLNLTSAITAIKLDSPFSTLSGGSMLIYGVK
jgi:hypothetical protein